MNETPTPEPAEPAAEPAVDPAVDLVVDPAVDLVAQRADHRDVLRTRHAQGLARLMTERGDLRGVHALADFVDDALRWTA